MDGEFEVVDRWPRIISQGRTRISPWVDIVEREVEFAPGEITQIYHSVAQSDYLAIVAVTPDGHFPLVRQYRPAVEMFTLELPAGLLEVGEDPFEGSKRELLEETGYPTEAIHFLGTAAPCTGRLSNRIHSFFSKTGNRVDHFAPEPGITVELATPSELLDLIKSGEFILQSHLGALLLAQVQSFVTLG